MCGIAGLINLNGKPVSYDILKRMTDAIAHRGPDGEGQWVEENIGIGHRRLAVIDLSAAAAQPMFSADKRFVISYNGELYNYRELRAELESRGVSFFSQSDTEVILNALIIWGDAAISRFNGMFAFVLWDRCEKRLLLGRDRYGIKPLYYAHIGNTFGFGSEQKAIFAQPGFLRQLDKPALLEYFTFQNIFSDRTLLQNIKLFPAGHYGIIDLFKENPGLKLTQYWDFNFCDPTGPIDQVAYCEELDRLFQQAVKRQLVTDVELGCYLSGGMDSGSITAIAAKTNNYIKTFTCGFDLSSVSGLELAFDERNKAEFLSNYFKTEHYEIVLKAGDMERVLPQLAWHIEEPRVGQSYPNFYAAKLASKFVKVVLSGAGGDELFGGYPWRYYRAVINDDFESYIDKYYQFWQRLLPNSEIRTVFSPVWEEVKDVWTRDIFRNVFSCHQDQLTTPEEYINQSLYFEAKTFLHGLLVVEDKLSMAHGLESRVPFLDNDLVDFAMRCPVSLKLNNLAEVIRINENDPGKKFNNYFERTNDGKQILRDAMAKHVPQEVMKREKQGFSGPDASWFKGNSIKFVRNQLMNPSAKLYSFFDYKSVIKLVEQHFDGSHNRRLLIWSLLNFEAWSQLNIK